MKKRIVIIGLLGIAFGVWGLHLDGTRGRVVRTLQ